MNRFDAITSAIREGGMHYASAAVTTNEIVDSISSL